MFHVRRVVYVALTVLAVSAPVVVVAAGERRRVTHHRQQELLLQSSTSDVPAKVDSPVGVAVVPRAGTADPASPSLISQSASILMGMILALNSGFINGCALSGAVTGDGSTQAVAAVTASWTNSALGLASGNMAKFGFLSKVLGSFIFGSLIAGYLEPKPSQFLVSSSSYGMPLTVAAIFTALSKTFLEAPSSVKLGFYLLCMANGINNSVTSTMTSNLCRTSHFTGISSDMGTFIGQILRGNKTNLFKLKVFAALAASFWSGGYLSYEFSKTYGSSILYVSAAVYLFMALGYEKFAKSVFA